MNARYVLLNILPLPLWIGWYLSTIRHKELFMMPVDEIAVFMIVVGFTIFNIFSKSVVKFLIRNLTTVISLMVGCFISGQIYLTLCNHMSDEHYAVYTVLLDIVIAALLITAIGCAVSYFINRKS